jgi:hypothetical protein
MTINSQIDDLNLTGARLDNTNAPLRPRHNFGRRLLMTPVNRHLNIDTEIDEHLDM